MTHNAIEDLIGTGFVDDVIAAALPGECYQFTGIDGIHGPEPIAADMVACRQRLATAAVNCPGKVSMWFAVSTDRRRIMGEIVHHDGYGRPSIVWSIEADGHGGVRLIYPHSHQISFPSHVDLAEAVVEPNHLVDLIEGERAGKTLGALDQLGYAIKWRSNSKLSQNVSAFDLVAS